MRVQHDRCYYIPVATAEDDETLAEAFWTVTRKLRQRSRDALAPLGIAPSHFRAIGVLMRHGTMRLSELSEHLHIAPRSATEVVDALAERGLVERRPDPDDRRATLVALTPQGSELSDSIRASRAEQTDRFFDDLSAGDRAHLKRILYRLR